MPVSETVSLTRFETRKVVEHAYRRCKVAPQEVTTERAETALDLLYMLLSSLASKGIPLWAIQRVILPLYRAVPQVPCPVGTVDVLDVELRRLQRLGGIASATEGDADNAFDGDIDSACVQVNPGGHIQAQFEAGPTWVPNFGLLFGSTGTWEIEIQGSNDGMAFETLYTNATLTAVDREWFWWDIAGMREWEYLRLQAGAGTTLNVREWVLGNRPNEIPLAQVNLTDYANLPDKTFLSRPTQYWYDRQREQPILTLWPSPGPQFTFQQLILYVKRHIMDVGTLRQELELRQTWWLAIVDRLALELARSDKSVTPELIPLLESASDRSWREAWDGESDGSKVKLAVNISPYTR